MVPLEAHRKAKQSMPKYSVTALDRDHSRQERTVEAADEAAARALVDAEGLLMISAERLPETSLMSREFRIRHRTPRSDEISQLASDLATRLASGVDLSRSLVRLAAQKAGTPLGEALDDVNRRVRTAENTHLPDAFWAHEDIFGKLFCALFEAGFASGNLADEMDHAAELLADRDEFSRKVYSALLQPLMLFVFAIIVVVVMVSLVLPVYTGLFKAFGTKLPLPTLILLGIYRPAAHYWYLILLAILVGVFGFRWALDQERFRRRWDDAILRIPKVDDLLAKSAMYRMSSTLSGMMAANLNIFEAISYAATAAGNLRYRDAMQSVGESMRSDALPLSVAVRKAKVFPLLFLDAIENGEESGHLNETLRKYVKRTGIELKTTTERFQQSFQPLVNVAIMIVIGLIVIALIAPQYEIIGIMAKASGGG